MFENYIKEHRVHHSFLVNCMQYCSIGHHSTQWPNGQCMCDLSTVPLQSRRYLLESGWGRSFFSFRNLYKKFTTTVHKFWICNSMMITYFSGTGNKEKGGEKDIKRSALFHTVCKCVFVCVYAYICTLHLCWTG